MAEITTLGAAGLASWLDEEQQTLEEGYRRLDSGEDLKKVWHRAGLVDPDNIIALEAHARVCMLKSMGSEVLGADQALERLRALPSRPQLPGEDHALLQRKHELGEGRLLGEQFYIAFAKALKDHPLAH